MRAEAAQNPTHENHAQKAKMIPSLFTFEGSNREQTHSNCGSCCGLWEF
jgi:hypothetical protein